VAVGTRHGHAIHLPLKVESADTFFTRFRGLMFRTELSHDRCLHIVPCNSIHMFFMRFAIDVVFLNREREIVKLKQDVRPWGLIWPVPNAHSVLEMPVGIVQTLDLNIGDTLEWT